MGETSAKNILLGASRNSTPMQERYLPYTQVLRQNYAVSTSSGSSRGRVFSFLALLLLVLIGFWNVIINQLVSVAKGPSVVKMMNEIRREGNVSFI
jgi:hypothetical protein